MKDTVGRPQSRRVKKVIGVLAELMLSHCVKPEVVKNKVGVTSKKVFAVNDERRINHSHFAKYHKNEVNILEVKIRNLEKIISPHSSQALIGSLDDLRKKLLVLKSRSSRSEAT